VCLAAVGCVSPTKETTELRAKRASLRGEIAGLRDAVARLERGEPFLPAGDVLVAVDESLVRRIVDSQFPLEVDVDRFHLHLDRVDVNFQETQMVRLWGEIRLLDSPQLVARVSAVGSLDRFVPSPGTAAIESHVRLDHITVEHLAALEALVGPGAIEQLEEAVRLRVMEILPPIRIPVGVHERIDIPALHVGRFHFSPVSQALRVTVSAVQAGRGRLWIALHVEPAAGGGAS
jgi:hypothetical protein